MDINILPYEVARYSFRLYLVISTNCIVFVIFRNSPHKFCLVYMQTYAYTNMRMKETTKVPKLNLKVNFKLHPIPYEG